MADNDKLAQVKELLNSLNALQLAQLAQDLQDEWGVSAAAPAIAAMPGMMVPGAAAEGAAEEEEKTEFDVVITDVGPNKIQVIKAVRELTALGLREAKEAVEAGPDAPIRQGISKEEAEETKKRLEEAGATVEIR
ncbi:MAG: 50S ribosomal protein L7/L12 [Chloroflexi bacterium]|nr:MAG: 50S ribosomal protein L7/L12 [Chloroflexota bacterium]